MSQFKTLYDKAISDQKFRAELVNNPSAALQSIGIHPTPQVLSSLGTALTAIEALGTELSPAMNVVTDIS